jgi:hypothetical protein
MDVGKFNLFLKMIEEEYKLSHEEIDILTHRLLADDKEFEKIWKLYKNKNATYSGGVDKFKSILNDLLN